MLETEKEVQLKTAKPNYGSVFSIRYGTDIYSCFTTCMIDK